MISGGLPLAGHSCCTLPVATLMRRNPPVLAPAARSLPFGDQASDRVGSEAMSRGALPPGTPTLTVASSAPLASCLPVRDQASENTAPSCFHATLPASAFACHRRTVLSAEPLASVRPSAHATQVTDPSCPVNVRTGLPVASHSRTVLSCEAVARSLPSPDQATAVTPPSWPSSRATRLPVVVFHSETTASPMPVTSGRPGVYCVGTAPVTSIARSCFGPSSVQWETAAWVPANRVPSIVKPSEVAPS